MRYVCCIGKASIVSNFWVCHLLRDLNVESINNSIDIKLIFSLLKQEKKDCISVAKANMKKLQICKGVIRYDKKKNKESPLFSRIIVT